MDNFTKCQKVADKLTLKQYCNALYHCLTSQWGEYEEYCEGCPFERCCIMSESPDTMVFEILGAYEYLPDLPSDIKEAMDKSLKYDKIARIVKEDCNN